MKELTASDKQILAFELGIIAESECLINREEAIKELAKLYEVNPDTLLGYYHTLDMTWKNNQQKFWKNNT